MLKVLEDERTKNNENAAKLFEKKTMSSFFVTVAYGSVDFPILPTQV